METSDQQYTNEEQLIEDKFQELLNGYLNSNHRKKVEIIERAFKFAKEAHKGIRRRSGEPYILHPIAVARIVSQEIGLGSTSICSALLHDVVEDTEYTVEDIENHFGKKIASIVDGLTKISGGIFGDQASAQAENFRRLLLTMSEDIRVILIKMADRLHIPVVNTMMAKGVVPKDDRYSLWTIGIPQKDYVNQVFDRADVVIAIGYDIVECAPAKWGARPDMTIVHIDNAPADVNKRYQPAVEVVGDISESVYEILRCARRGTEPEFALELRRTMEAEHEAMANDDSCPMKPARILADVRKVMGRSDILVSDVGAHKMWIARHYDCYEPNTCLISNGFASMGFSIPGAFAAKLLYPDKKVLAVCGDGGFMMNSQELETAVREKVPFVTLIWEDSSYGLIKWKEQEQFGGEHCYVDFTNPDFKMLAEAMHCKGYRVEKAEDLIPTLEEAFRQDVPSVIVVPVDYSENMKLSEHLKEVYTKKQEAII